MTSCFCLSHSIGSSVYSLLWTRVYLCSVFALFILKCWTTLIVNRNELGTQKIRQPSSGTNILFTSDGQKKLLNPTMHVQECKGKKLIMDGCGGSLDNFWVWWSNTFTKKANMFACILHITQSVYTEYMSKHIQCIHRLKMLTSHVWASFYTN